MLRQIGSLHPQAIAGLVLASFVILSGCGGGGETGGGNDGSAAPTSGTPRSQLDEVKAAMLRLMQAAANGDIAALDELLSDECELKGEVLLATEITNAFLPGELEVRMPLDALHVEFVGNDLALVTGELGRGTVLLNGRPIDIDEYTEQVPTEFIREADGRRRVQDCEVVKNEAS